MGNQKSNGRSRQAHTWSATPDPAADNDGRRSLTLLRNVRIPYTPDPLEAITVAGNLGVFINS